MARSAATRMHTRAGQITLSARLNISHAYAGKYSGNEWRSAWLRRRPCEQWARRMEEEVRISGRRHHERNNYLVRWRQAPGSRMRKAERTMLEVHPVFRRGGVMVGATGLVRLAADYRTNLAGSRKTPLDGCIQRMGNRRRERSHKDSKASYPCSNAPVVSTENHAGKVWSQAIIY